MPRLLSLLPLAALLLPSLAFAEDAWLTQEVQALPWPDAEKVSVALEAGDKVVVIYRMEELVRVRKDDSYGWVPQAILSDQDPTPAVEDVMDAWDVPDMPTLELPTLGSGPKLTPSLDASPAAPATPAPAEPAPE